jgi:hypothetical protein
MPLLNAVVDRMAEYPEHFVKPDVDHAYFDQMHGLTFDIFLKSIRPGQLSPESKAKLIGIFPKRDIVGDRAL